MTMKELSRCTTEELNRMKSHMISSGNYGAARIISDVQAFYHKTVRVIKGRKVPHGVIGECFWMGKYSNSRYGDPWGVYTTVRIGIKDAKGNIYWTSLDNVELA